MKDERYKLKEDRFTLLKEAIEAVPVGITITDLKGRIVYTNHAEAEIHGYTVEELIGKDARMLAPPDLWKSVSFKQLHEMGAWRRESINIKKTGKTFPVHLMSIAVKDEKGVPIGIVTACEDITERKRAEEELKESEQRYRKQFEEAIDAMFLADLETGMIVDCNIAASKLLEREKSDIIGKHQSFLHPAGDIKDGISRTFKSHMIGDSSELLEGSVITRSGQIKDVAIRASKMTIEGKKVMQGIFRDITDRKKAEKEIQKRVKELEEFYAIAVDRELRMKKMKEEIEELKEELQGYRMPANFIQ